MELKWKDNKCCPFFPVGLWKLSTGDVTKVMTLLENRIFSALSDFTSSLNLLQYYKYDRRSVAIIVERTPEKTVAEKNTLDLE